MKIAVLTLGCKVNQYESEGIIRLLDEMGYETTSLPEKADVYIINTCAVTNEAEKKSRHLVSKCLNINKNARVIICGCASENNPKQFDNKKNIIYITGTSNKYKVIDAIENDLGINIYKSSDIFEDGIIPKKIRTRMFLKIQDGCNHFCSYCIIPYLRGRSRSKKISEVRNDCLFCSKYAKEIVLTGIDLSSYGIDFKSSLIELLDNLKDIKSRIRLGSLEPRLINDEFLKKTKEMYSFCPQFHLSLQSGSDTVLKRMRRGYKTKTYYEKVKLIYEYYPNASITTDIICGFPGETEEEFNETLNFIKQIGFAQVHVFGYSKRDGTKAAKMEQIDPTIIKQRVLKTERISKKVKKDFLFSFLDKDLEVLFEKYVDKDGYRKGHSKNFISVYKKNAKSDTIETVRIKDLYKDGVIVYE